MKNSLLSLLLAATALPASAALRVVATTPDHAALLREVAGPLARVESLSTGHQNAHHVDPKPSFIVKTMKADLFVENGLELEVGWSGAVLAAARVRRLMPGAPGHLDASTAVEALEIPHEVTREHGDAHPGGNPHYTQDPVRAGQVAALFAKKLSELDPANAAGYEAGRAAFQKKLDAKLAGWAKRLAPFKGTKVVTYHRDWVYFSERFGLVCFGELEPKPGIPPTAQHTAELVARMKAEGVRLVVTVPWYEDRTPRAVAEAAGARVAKASLLPGAFPGTDDYFGWMDHNVEAVATALEAR